MISSAITKILFLLGLALVCQQAPTIQQATQCKMEYCPINYDYWDKVSKQQASNFDLCFKGNQVVYNQLKQQGWAENFTPDYLNLVSDKCKPATQLNSFYSQYVYSCDRSCEASAAPNFNEKFGSVKSVQACMGKCPVCDYQDDCISQQFLFEQCQQKSQQCFLARKILEKSQPNDPYPSQMKPCLISCNPNYQKSTFANMYQFLQLHQTNTTNFTKIYNCKLDCLSSANYASIISLGFSALVALVCLLL